MLSKTLVNTIEASYAMFPIIPRKPIVLDNTLDSEWLLSITDLVTQFDEP